MKTETPTQRDYFHVALSDDKKEVKVTFLNTDGGFATVNLDQQAAITLAGEIQGFAIQIK